MNENLGRAIQEMGFHNPRFHVVNNVVDLQRFQAAIQEAPLNRFLHVSCFDEAAKNTKGLLRAFKNALAQRPDLFLTLVGEGPDFQMTLDYSNELGLSPYVEFTGLQMGDELVKSFQENGTFLMFSNYENQPVVILESFACGIPVIATAVGGIPEMLAEGRGILVEAGDEKAMTEALIQRAEGHFSTNPATLRDYVRELYSYEAVGKLYAQLYEEALNERN